MEKIPITIPEFNENDSFVSTRIEIPDTMDYFIFYIYAMPDDTFAYKIEYYQEERDVIEILIMKLNACKCLIPTAYNKVIPYNIECTTEYKEAPIGKTTFLEYTNFYLYKNSDLDE